MVLLEPWLTELHRGRNQSHYGTHPDVLCPLLLKPRMDQNVGLHESAPGSIFQAKALTCSTSSQIQLCSPSEDSVPAQTLIILSIRIFIEKLSTWDRGPNPMTKSTGHVWAVSDIVPISSLLSHLFYPEAIECSSLETKHNRMDQWAMYSR